MTAFTARRCIRRGASIILFTHIAAGCAATPRRAGAVNDAYAPVRIVVDNGTWFDMSLFVQPEAGGRFRIGSIGAGETRVFIVRLATLGSGSFRIVGDPIGSLEMRATDLLPAMGGTTAYWRVGVSAATSSTTIR